MRHYLLPPLASATTTTTQPPPALPSQSLYRLSALTPTCDLLCGSSGREAPSQAGAEGEEEPAGDSLDAQMREGHSRPASLIFRRHTRRQTQRTSSLLRGQTDRASIIRARMPACILARATHMQPATAILGTSRYTPRIHFPDNHFCLRYV